MRFLPVQIVTNGDMSMNINSFGININQGVNWSIQAEWSGTPTGSFKIQTSNDEVAPAPPYNKTAGDPLTDPAVNVVNWNDYTGSSLTVTAQAGVWSWYDSNVGYQWVRLVWTAGSGTGTLNAVFNGKGV